MSISLSRNYSCCSFLKFDDPVSVCIEALPGVLGNRGTRATFSDEQGNKGLKIRGTGGHRQFWDFYRKSNFVFGEQGKNAIFFEGNKGTGKPPGRASVLLQSESELFTGDT